MGKNKIGSKIKYTKKSQSGFRNLFNVCFLSMTHSNVFTLESVVDKLFLEFKT